LTTSSSGELTTLIKGAFKTKETWRSERNPRKTLTDNLKIELKTKY
jgi:hypothetical protein